ncbi:unnamed protein product [Sphagnum tenellum]
MSCLSSGDDGLEDDEKKTIGNDEDKFRADEKAMGSEGMVGQWGMLEFLFQAMSGCWGMTKASSDDVKEMPKDTEQGRCRGVLVSVEKLRGC